MDIDKPAAILGNSPCLDDITDMGLMMQERTVFSINKAAAQGPCHVAVMADTKAAMTYAADISKDAHSVVTTTAVVQNLSAGRRRDRLESRGLWPLEKIWGGREVTVIHDPGEFRRNPQGSANLLMRWLHVRVGVEEVELYGFDMLPEEYSGHLDRLLEDINAGLHVWNCCPSSGLPSWVPKRKGLPWISQKSL